MRFEKWEVLGRSEKGDAGLSAGWRRAEGARAAEARTAE
jgi:hypothetical protein